jgi:hypothetical protein
MRHGAIKGRCGAVIVQLNIGLGSVTRFGQEAKRQGQTERTVVEADSWPLL